MSKKAVVIIVIVGLIIGCAIAGGTFYAGYASARGFNTEDIERAAQEVRDRNAAAMADLQRRIDGLLHDLAALNPDLDIEDIINDYESDILAAEGTISELSGKYAAALQTIKSNLEELQTLRGGELEAYQDQLTQINAEMADIEGTDPGYEQALAVVNLAISSTQSAIDALTEQIAAVDDLMDALSGADGEA